MVMFNIYLYLHIFFFLVQKEGIAKSLSAYLSVCETYNFFSSCESKHRMENEVDHMFASNKIGSHIVLLENKLLSKLQFVDNNTNLMKAPQCMIPIHINLFHETRI